MSVIIDINKNYSLQELNLIGEAVARTYYEIDNGIGISYASDIEIAEKFIKIVEELEEKEANNEQGLGRVCVV